MKKLRTLLALLVASFGLCTAAWARTAPTLPTTHAILEDGQTYYLYNILSNKFVEYVKDSSIKGEGSARKGDTGSPVRFEQTGDYYKLYNSENGTLIRKYQSVYGDYHYGCAWETSMMNATTNTFTLTISDSGDGYSIMSSDGYYLYFHDGYDDLRADVKSLSEPFQWRLIAEDDAVLYQKYIQRLYLYAALEATNSSNFDVSKYDNIYEDENSTVDDLKNALVELKQDYALSNGIAKHSLHEYPIWLDGDGWAVNGTNIKKWTNSGESSELRGYVIVDKEAALYYKTSDSYGSIEVYIDGVEVRSMSREQLQKTYSNPFFEKLAPGEHEIVWRFNHTQGHDATMQEIGVIATPQVSVSLLEPGSLGTEVLYYVDGVKDVRNLKITGKMNADDWAKIDMMTNLFALDLSDADVTEIANGQFAKLSNKDYGSWSFSRKFSNMYLLTLPSKLEKIGEAAFGGLLAWEVEIPTTVTSIGQQAFQDSRIKRANIPNVIDISKMTFFRCPFLEDIALSENLASIGESAFSNSASIKTQTITLPKSLTKIGDNAFYGCTSLNFRFPEKPLSIGREAFHNTAIDSLIIYQNMAFPNGTSPFYSLPQLTYVELPVGTYDVNYYLQGCPKLNKIVMKSPTVTTHSLLNITLANVTIVVPDYLVNSYKLDSYWYNAKAIEGFSTSEIDYWAINGNLTLNARDRFEGKPKVDLYSGYLKVNGDAPMTFENFYVRNPAMVLSNSDNITTDMCRIGYGLSAKKWAFVSLPFDTKVGDIYNNNDAKMAIRYYDGVARAANGTGGSWKDYAADDVIAAGAGFIIQASAATQVYFTAVDNETKQNIFSNKIFEKPLDANVSETTANKGWNLVGNPWQTYFNNHKLNFTAPITVWNGSTYVAYSLIDDDYAIKPNEAFFVQCPDEVTEIGFPTDGRQLTIEITDQNGAKPFGAQQAKTRWLADVEISNGELADKTRLVVNDAASLRYETACDASKFFSMDAVVPQVYTIDSDGTQLAINERPLADGEVVLGVLIPAEGTYTFSAPRNEFSSLMLIDHETGTKTDLTQSTYTFACSAGTVDGRFTLSFKDGAITAIDHQQTDGQGNAEIFDLSGRKMSESQMTKGIYVVRQGNKIQKMMVK